MDKVLISILVILLSACSTPARIESKLATDYSYCFVTGDTVDEVKSCLPLSVADDLKQFGDLYLYKTCKPYFSYPPVNSCAGFKLTFNGSQRLKSWKTLTYYDELLK